MITADKLQYLVTLRAQELTALIRKSGYKEDKFKSAKFLGMTNAGMFCYSCVYPGDFEDTCKVFVRINSDDTLTAEY
jgi:hypothetical protein